jgi:hypothetical protein
LQIASEEIDLGVKASVADLGHAADVHLRNSMPDAVNTSTAAGNATASLIDKRAGSIAMTSMTIAMTVVSTASVS